MNIGLLHPFKYIIKLKAVAHPRKFMTITGWSTRLHWTKSAKALSKGRSCRKCLNCSIMNQCEGQTILANKDECKFVIFVHLNTETNCQKVNSVIASPGEPTNLASEIRILRPAPKISGPIFSPDSSRSPQIVPLSQHQRRRSQHHRGRRHQTPTPLSAATGAAIGRH
jgi:hypothetical protein